MNKICNKTIEYSFYALFLLVPLVFTQSTSELFELNKMWLTWGLTIIIGMGWLTKMILQKRIILQRTPLDIPIGLFLASQIISTIFSWDVHVSIWGYYSRFNGGLLSIISYIFLYYAFLSNSPTIAKTLRLMAISLITGLIVALWGLPSHFGYDPTCFIFRGNFDVSCWTADFQPRVRIFSTLGQPNWLAAYLAILIPISIAMFVINLKSKNIILTTCYIILTTLFFFAFFYSRSQSGFLGVAAGLFVFSGLYLRQSRKQFSNLAIKQLLVIFLLFAIAMFFARAPIDKLYFFSYDSLSDKLNNTQTKSEQPPKNETPKGPALDTGITTSGNIRSIVWKGALNVWKNNPLFGTGIETFAYAYYKYKLPEHNLTSEWNFLYNKAHNEYLNYLATTGAFGLGSYLLMIGWFTYLVIKQLKTAPPAGGQNSKLEKDKLLALSFNFELCTLSFALLSAYIATLVINFFGFSVVITNIYLFMIPAFVFVLGGIIKPDNPKETNDETSVGQWTAIFFVFSAAAYMLFMLFRFWQADKAYGLGYNLSRAGQYQDAYNYLKKAVDLRGDEPVFKDELSVNNAIIVTGLMNQKDENTKEQTLALASSLTQEAIILSNEMADNFSQNVAFLKSRVRLFYTLSQADSRYLPRALEAIEKAADLSPNDANVFYNLGVLYGQNNNIEKGIRALEKTVKLKPDYRDAHYALGLFYHEMKDPVFQKKAIAEMNYILSIFPSDTQALESLKNWANKTF